MSTYDENAASKHFSQQISWENRTAVITQLDGTSLGKGGFCVALSPREFHDNSSVCYVKPEKKPNPMITVCKPNRCVFLLSRNAASFICTRISNGLYEMMQHFASNAVLSTLYSLFSENLFRNWFWPKQLNCSKHLVKDRVLLWLMSAGLQVPHCGNNNNIDHGCGMKDLTQFAGPSNPPWNTYSYPPLNSTSACSPSSEESSVFLILMTIIHSG